MRKKKVRIHITFLTDIPVEKKDPSKESLTDIISEWISEHYGEISEDNSHPIVTVTVEDVTTQIGGDAHKKYRM